MVEQQRYIHWQQRLREQGPQLLILLLSLVLILSTAQSAARLSWRIFDLVRPIHERSITTTDTGHDGSNNIVRPEKVTLEKKLMDLHLFGQAGRMTAATGADSRDLPQTTLHLTLIGVIFSSSPENAVAIIMKKDSTDEAVIYGVGDQLPGNSVLREIQPDRIILTRAGNQEILLIDEGLSTPSTPATGKFPKIRPTVQRPQSRMKARGMKARRNQAPIRPGDDDGASLNIDRTFLNEKITNLPSLASEIHAEPYQVAGDQQGFRLQAGGSSALLSQLGLKNGDVLTEVNGMPLRSNADVMKAYKEMKNAEKFQVQFLRNGTQQSMEYNIGQH